MIQAYLVGDEQVKALLRAVYPKTIPALSQTVNNLAIELSGYIKSSKLSGQVLNNRTGTLRRKVTHRVETRTGNMESVTGVVGTKLEYAAIHEYGFSGEESVKEHCRTITKAFGKPITPREVLVSAFTRTMNMPCRSFLRSGLADKKDEIEKELAKVFRKVVVND